MSNDFIQRASQFNQLLQSYDHEGIALHIPQDNTVQHNVCYENLLQSNKAGDWLHILQNNNILQQNLPIFLDGLAVRLPFKDMRDDSGNYTGYDQVLNYNQNYFNAFSAKEEEIKATGKLYLALRNTNSNSAPTGGGHFYLCQVDLNTHQINIINSYKDTDDGKKDFFGHQIQQFLVKTNLAKEHDVFQTNFYISKSNTDTNNLCASGIFYNICALEGGVDINSIPEKMPENLAKLFFHLASNNVENNTELKNLLTKLQTGNGIYTNFNIICLNENSTIPSKNIKHYGEVVKNATKDCFWYTTNSIRNNNTDTVFVFGANSGHFVNRSAGGGGQASATSGQSNVFPINTISNTLDSKIYNFYTNSAEQILTTFVKNGGKVVFPTSDDYGTSTCGTGIANSGENKPYGLSGQKYATDLFYRLRLIETEDPPAKYPADNMAEYNEAMNELEKQVAKMIEGKENKKPEPQEQPSELPKKTPKNKDPAPTRQKHKPDTRKLPDENTKDIASQKNPIINQNVPKNNPQVHKHYQLRQAREVGFWTTDIGKAIKALIYLFTAFIGGFLLEAMGFFGNTKRQEVNHSSKKNPIDPKRENIYKHKSRKREQRLLSLTNTHKKMGQEYI